MPFLKKLFKKKKDPVPTEKELEELTENAYKILKNKIATTKDLPDDVLESFRRLTEARKGWFLEMSGLEEPDALKETMSRAYWLELEFGVYIEHEKDLEIPGNTLENLRKMVVKNIKFNIDKKFLKNPFSIFDERDGYLPTPQKHGKFNDKSLKIRYYYPIPKLGSKEEEEEESKEVRKLSEMLLEWWDMWSSSYMESTPMAYLHRQGDGWEWIYEGAGEDDYPVHLFIARVRTFHGKCFALGHSAFTGKRAEDGCELLTYP